jgi:hypothetical protein
MPEFSHISPGQSSRSGEIIIHEIAHM